MLIKDSDSESDKSEASEKVIYVYFDRTKDVSIW